MCFLVTKYFIYTNTTCSTSADFLPKHKSKQFTESHNPKAEADACGRLRIPPATAGTTSSPPPRVAERIHDHLTNELIHFKTFDATLIDALGRHSRAARQVVAQLASNLPSHHLPQSRNCLTRIPESRNCLPWIRLLSIVRYRGHGYLSLLFLSCFSPVHHELSGALRYVFSRHLLICVCPCCRPRRSSKACGRLF